MPQLTQTQTHIIQDAPRRVPTTCTRAHAHTTHTAEKRLRREERRVYARIARPMTTFCFKRLWLAYRYGVRCNAHMVIHGGDCFMMHSTPFQVMACHIMLDNDVTIDVHGCQHMFTTRGSARYACLSEPSQQRTPAA